MFPESHVPTSRCLLESDASIKLSNGESPHILKSHARDFDRLSKPCSLISTHCFNGGNDDVQLTKIDE